MSTEEEKNLRRAERNLTRKGLVNELVDYEWEYEKGKLILKNSEDFRVFYGNQYYDLKVGLDFEERLVPSSPRRRSVSRDLLKTDGGLRERTPIFFTLLKNGYKSLYYGILLLGGIGLGNPLFRKLISTDPIIATCMPMESANPVVTALEMGLPGLATTFGTGGTSRVVVRDESSGVFSLGNAPQRPVHVAALERQASEQHFFTESESVSSQENDESSADASGGSSHSQSESQEGASAQSESQEEASAQSESQEEVSAQSESQEEISAPSSEETTKKQKKHKKKSRGARKGVQSRSDSEEDRTWREDTSWKEGFETSSAPNKGKGKGIERARFTKDDFKKVKERLNLNAERNCDLAGVNPAYYTNHYPSSNDAPTLLFRRLQRIVGTSPFDNIEELGRTAPAPFVSQDLLATTPRAKGYLTAEICFSEDPKTPTKVSELDQSDEPSAYYSQDGEKTLLVLLSEQNKTTILKEAPPGSRIVVNQGEEGLNDANTQLSMYLERSDVQKELKTYFGKYFKPKFTQYDHARGSTEQQNMNFVQNASHNYNYKRAPTLSTTVGMHQQKTNERAAFESYSLSLSNMDPSISITNNGTMFDVSYINEELDVAVVMSMPQSELDKFGITREDTVQATRDVHHLDRLHIAYNMRCMGIDDATAYKNFTQVNNANKTTSLSNWELMEVVLKASPEKVQSPAFIEIVFDTLTYNLQSKQFNESIRSLYEINTPVERAIRISRQESDFNLGRLCDALAEKGVDIGNLRKYNPDLRGVAAFDLNHLAWSDWQKSELCQSLLEMDVLAIKIKASVTSQGRARILPSSVALKKFLPAAPAESSAMGALEGGSSSAPQALLGITDSPVEPSSSAPLEEGDITPSAEKSAKKASISGASKRAPRVQSASTTSRKTSSKAAPAKKNYQGAGNSKALTVRTPPKP